jgi:hypothetical protein
VGEHHRHYHHRNDQHHIHHHMQPMAPQPLPAPLLLRNSPTCQIAKCRPHTRSSTLNPETRSPSWAGSFAATAPSACNCCCSVRGAGAVAAAAHVVRRSCSLPASFKTIRRECHTNTNKKTQKHTGRCEPQGHQIHLNIDSVAPSTSSTCALAPLSAAALHATATTQPNPFTPQ